jgi:hypothetical protein
VAQPALGGIPGRPVESAPDLRDLDKVVLTSVTAELRPSAANMASLAKSWPRACS